MRFFSTFLREPVFGPFYHMNYFRHSRQVYLVHSGWQNEGRKVIIKITDWMFFNLLMGTWFSMQRQEGGGGSSEGECYNVIQTNKSAASTSKQIKALQALHHIPLLHLHQASFMTLSKIKCFLHVSFYIFCKVSRTSLKPFSSYRTYMTWITMTMFKGR